MSCGDHQRKWFKVAECIYHVWISKAKVLKLRNLYIMSGSPKEMFYSSGVYISGVDDKENVLQLWSLSILFRSPKKMF